MGVVDDAVVSDRCRLDASCRNTRPSTMASTTWPHSTWFAGCRKGRSTLRPLSGLH